MSRRVITQSEIIDAKQKEQADGTILYNETEQKRVSQQSADDTASKIIKYIPAEITAAYVAAEASVKSVTSLAVRVDNIWDSTTFYSFLHLESSNCDN
jgi:hypothetical protein